MQRAWIQIIRDLAHAIEDCIDRFMHRVTTMSEKSWIRQAVHRVHTASVRTEFAKAIRELKKISQESSKLRETYYSAGSIVTGSGTSSCLTSSVAFETAEDAPLSARSPVGIDAPQDELLELIQQQQQHLKVISIVGFDGIGKTLLARHVYETLMSQYEARAWVCAAVQGSAMDVVKEILRQLGIPTSTHGGGSLSKLCTNIRQCIESKR